MRLRNVYTVSHKNQDGSLTFALRWVVVLGGGRAKHHYERVLRTEPGPSRASLRAWQREVAQVQLVKERELNAHASEFVQPMRVERIVQEYVAFCQESRAASTAERMERGLGFFAEYLADSGGPKNISGLSVSHAARYRDYLAERGLAASTVNCYLADLSGLLKWCVAEGYAADNPVRRVRRLDRNMDRATVPLQTPGQLWEMLDRLSTDVRRSTVGLLATTGIRIGEAAALTWENWQRDEDLLILVPHGRRVRTKRHGRSIPLIDFARHCLMSLAMVNDLGEFIVGPQRGQIALKTQPNAWLKPFGLTPHDLRRFFRTALESCGVEMYAIDDLMGHRTTRVRAAYTPAENRETARRAMITFGTWLQSR